MVYLTNYNTFTLKDLVSYDRKHNEENGEKGKDGKSLNERMTSTMRYVVKKDGSKVQSIVPVTKAPT